MIIFRYQVITRIFCVFTGVIFLNMGFFLAEVCLLNLKDRHMIENVTKLVLNGGLEEERDAHAGGDVPGKMFSLLSNESLIRHASLFLIAVKIHQVLEDLYPHADHSTKFSPPPDSFVRIS